MLSVCCVSFLSFLFLLAYSLMRLFLPLNTLNSSVLLNIFECSLDNLPDFGKNIYAEWRKSRFAIVHMEKTQ